MSSATKKEILEKWNPDDAGFWDKYGKKIAIKNLWISIPALLLGFAVWFIWSIVIVRLNQVGFHFSSNELFSIAAMPGLVGATLRVIYSFMVPIFGGRNWTAFSTLILIIPAIMMGVIVQNPNTSYEMFLFVGALCGLGGGTFSSSMANISFFFPKNKQGAALGMNAGLGNLGVSVAQFLVPVVIVYSVFGALGGNAQHLLLTNTLVSSQSIWLQNAGFIWVLPILLVGIAAWIWMDNLPSAKSSFKEQTIIFKRKHMYLMTMLYIMSFGSYIGYCAAFPLLTKIHFPMINILHYAFLGPMLGALLRPVGGKIADMINSGAKIATVSTILMISSVVMLLYFTAPATRSFAGFFAVFMVLFGLTGLANGSIFRMMGVVFPPGEKAPVLGFSSAIAAYGAFILPKSFGFSINLTGSASLAFYGFLAFYVLCLVILFVFYIGKNSKVTG